MTRFGSWKSSVAAYVLSFVCLYEAAIANQPAPVASQPNILFIMADDHAAHAIGAYQGPLAALNPTPHIDRLAREGVRLTNCFVTNSICTPSRATILTGQYSHRTRCYGFANGIEAARQMLPQQMHAAGYETAIVGKWHLIHEPAAFDFYCVLEGQGSYFNPVFRAHADTKSILPWRFGRDLTTPAAAWPAHAFRVSGYDCIHADDAITDISLAWLKKRRGADKPFFLMHHFKGPHDNFENAERYDFVYDNAVIPEPVGLRNRGGHGPKGKAQYGTSVSKRNTRRNMGHHMFVDPDLPDEEYTTESYQRYLKKYLRTVRGVDDNVGRLLDYLEQADLLDNTIIAYTADQGFMLGEHDYIDKRWMYEPSLRMPFLIRYPARLAAGSEVSDLITNVDFAPTLLQLAGVPEDDFPTDLQGRSFLNNLLGKTPGDWPQATYYRYWLHMAHHDNPAHYGIRTATHKLIFFYGLPLDVKGAVATATQPYWELYDLVRDPDEMHNVYGDPDYADVTARLKSQLLELKAKVGDDDQQYPALMQVRQQYWN